MEKEVILSFNAEELLELAKLAILGHIMAYPDYENETLANKVIETICARGHAEFNEYGDYTHGCSFDDRLFNLSDVGDNGFIERSIEEHEDRVLEQRVSSDLAWRDLEEQHKKKMEPEEVIADPALLAEYEGILNSYKWELMLNGFDNLRLVKKKEKKRKK